MYSQKENLKKLKKTYKEQAIPKGLKEEIRQRFIIEEQSFIKAKRRKRRLQGFGVSLAIVMKKNEKVIGIQADIALLSSFF